MGIMPDTQTSGQSGITWLLLLYFLEMSVSRIRLFIYKKIYEYFQGFNYYWYKIIVSWKFNGNNYFLNVC